MDWGLVVLLFLHIGGGAIWLGASLFANAVLLPYVTTQPLDRRAAVVRSLVLGPERVIIAAALTASISGLILGLAYRGFGTGVSLTSPAGLIWLASIAVAVMVFATGGRVTSPAARALLDAATADGLTSDGPLRRLRLGFRVELTGIVAILALMVLLPRV